MKFVDERIRQLQPLRITFFIVLLLILGYIFFYLGLFQAAPQGIKAGQCFPAGHASTGFLWIVWAVALRPAGLRAARGALAVGLLAGAVLGTARMLQGAHFLSHTLWTLWLAWAASVSLALAVRADLGLGDRGGAWPHSSADRPHCVLSADAAARPTAA